ncbi:MAG TPA: hypothetical protein VIE64_01950 [Solirubrobacterales bacterium]|jgi:hypothetical protein
MDVLLGVLAVAAMVGIPIVGLPVAAVAIGVFDFPPGSQDLASDFLDNGGWVAVAAVGLVLLAVGIYAIKRQRETELSTVSDGT